MFIQTEATPNPEVLKFLPGKAVLGEGTRDFRSPDEASASPLAAELFGIEGVNRVFYGPDFITVGKQADEDWAHLKAPILASIMDHFTSGQPLFDDAGDSEAGGHDDGVYEGDTAQIVAEIKELLDTRIRPAVAQDG
uniref:NifU N-terminal domain-containing protein n=1 Tax=Phenylobacterium sp. TaxID=1871053 RepID=UPI0037C8EC5F